jgi:hypothetical protein
MHMLFYFFVNFLKYDLILAKMFKNLTCGKDVSNLPLIRKKAIINK